MPHRQIAASIGSTERTGAPNSWPSASAMVLLPDRGSPLITTSIRPMVALTSVTGGRMRHRAGWPFEVTFVAMGAARYDDIGGDYASTRREDPHLRERILAALGDSG